MPLKLFHILSETNQKLSIILSGQASRVQRGHFCRIKAKHFGLDFLCWVNYHCISHWTLHLHYEARWWHHAVDSFSLNRNMETNHRGREHDKKESWNNLRRKPVRGCELFEAGAKIYVSSFTARVGLDQITSKC